MVIQFKRLASPILASSSASRLNAVEVEIDNLYSAYEASSELDALLPEIETALEHLRDDASLLIAGGSTIVADSRLVELCSLVSADFDFRKLVRLCEEIHLWLVVLLRDRDAYTWAARPRSPGIRIQDIQ
jgi:hypothetical protein